jgi:hypothetical protein
MGEMKKERKTKRKDKSGNTIEEKEIKEKKED